MRSVRHAAWALVAFAVFAMGTFVVLTSMRTQTPDPAALYDELSRRHGFSLARSQLKVAVNAEFSDWSRPLADGDEVVFIPPVAGG